MLINPTEFDGTPRIFSALYSQFKVSLECQLATLAASATREQRDAIEKQVTEQYQHVFGKRVSTIVVGSAPCSDDVKAWVTKCFQCRVTDSYGTTEAGAIANDQSVKSGTVSIKLIDLPELGYLLTDKPFPRGEIAVKTNEMAVRYHRDAELTAKTWTVCSVMHVGSSDMVLLLTQQPHCQSDGFIRTGDIGELNTATGKLKLIGRVKHTLKLAQGEFVTPDRLQELYIRSRFVDQIYIHACSDKCYLIAVVVALDGALGSVDAATKQQVILQDLSRIAAEERLNNYEAIRGVVLAKEKFTEHNHLMTPSNKLCRRYALIRHTPLQLLSARISHSSAVMMLCLAIRHE
jgi:fatty acid CoA ligase FadD9